MPVLTNTKSPWASRFPDVLNHLPKDKKIPDNLVDGRDWVRDYFDPTKQRTLWLEYLENNRQTLGKSSSSIKETLAEYLKEHKGISVEDYWSKIRKRLDISYLDIVTLYKVAQDYSIENNSKASYIGEIVDNDSLEGFFG